MKIATHQAFSKAASVAREAVLSGDLSPQSIVAAIEATLLEEFKVHIGAALKEAGFEVDVNEPLTAASLSEVVSRKTGIEFSDVTNVNAIIEDIDDHVTKKINQLTGLQAASVMQPGALKEAIAEAVVRQLESGGAAGFGGPNEPTVRRYAAAVDWKNSKGEPFLKEGDGIVEGSRKVSNRIYQKRYRRTHKQEWQ